MHCAGVGMETVSELAKFGARVIMACRNPEKAESVKVGIVQKLKSLPGQEDIEQRIVVKKLDLASLKSVREFSEDILRSESRLDVLINNAGLAGIPERTLTEDGLEITMASNHYGHFLLTNLLLPLLKQSAPSRIVVVSSSAHKHVENFDFENLNSELEYLRLGIYHVSKMANMLFAQHLAKKLEGTNVVVNSVHPGFVDSEIYRLLPPWASVLLKPVFLFAKSPLQGAQTQIFLAASQAPEALVSGRYFEDMQEVEMAPMAKDEALAEQFWKWSEKLTGLSSE